MATSELAGFVARSCGHATGTMARRGLVPIDFPVRVFINTPEFARKFGVVPTTTRSHGGAF